MHDIGSFVCKHCYGPHHNEARCVVYHRDSLSKRLEKAGGFRNCLIIGLVRARDRHTGGRRIIERQVEEYVR